MSSAEPAPPVDETDPALAACMRRDRTRLHKLRRAGREADFEALRAVSAGLRERRAAARPALRFDDALPITARKAEIQAAIRDHQVVVVCGETGSGKSTQLPKLCLEMGRGVDGFIGHTQPRRVAARAIAERLAAELGDEVGGHAGYKFRFAEELADETYIKVLTDGMLLAELESDRRLDQYDTLIIDEAHERSLNIDFLLGILKRLLAKRPDLKVLITSATIDPEQFARYFDGAPVIEVSGRTYPVEVRYRPFEHSGADAGERNLEVALLHAADELVRQGPGDILVFLPGEFHIRKAAELLRRKRYPDTEILPLYARLSGREQQRVFQPGSSRRIVLATNVAETSITVPGIRYVIDTGLARISRYRPARQVQALPIEPVSQASARQRAGRCGREADGVCIRLYSEQDFEVRETFTPPEVQRTSLASVILNMHTLHLGRVEDFPFIEPPPAKMIKAGYRLLAELGAVDDRQRLSAIGKRLARIPADPRIGRMLLAAKEHQCASEILTIAAALSIPDPRDYPADAREAARQAHAADRHDKSDFLGYLKLWQRYRRETRELSRRRRARWCRERYLSVMRMREWRNVRDQLGHIARELNIPLNTRPASETAMHRALLTGLLGNVARRDSEDGYLGTQGKRLFIHPSSALHKNRPKWLMCAELVQTRQLYARTVAAIHPKWVEGPARHLVKREHFDPWWDAGRGEVMARERVSLFGLILVSGRARRYGPVDPGAAREVFISQALVPGEIEPVPAFLRHNLDLIHELSEIQHRVRRRGFVIDDEALADFYDRGLPGRVRDAKSLAAWLNQASPAERQALQLDEDAVRAGALEADYPERFPAYLEMGGNRLALRYHFEPGHPDDGLTLRMPAPLARQLDEARLSWVVPGLLGEKISAMIRALPKARRRGVGPANDAALLCLRAMAPQDGESLAACLSRTLRAERGINIPPHEWNESSLPDHLRMNVEVVDADGKVLARGRDPAALKQRVQELAPAPPDDDASAAWRREGLTDWSFGTLPETVAHQRDGVRLRSFVALTERGGAAAIELFDDEGAARGAMARGLGRLLRGRLAGKLKYLDRKLPGIQRMCLCVAAVASCETLKRDIVDAAFGQLATEDPWQVRSRERFEAELASLNQHLVPTATQICNALAPALERFRDCMGRLDGLPAATRTDIAQQLDLLVFPGFVSYTPYERLAHLDRYLQAVQKRIERCGNNPERDRARLEKIQGYWQRLLMAHPPPPDPVRPELSAFRWILEEYRVSIFAQDLKTAEPVSEKRLDRQWQAYQSLDERNAE